MEKTQKLENINTEIEGNHEEREKMVKLMKKQLEVFYLFITKFTNTLRETYFADVIKEFNEQIVVPEVNSKIHKEYEGLKDLPEMEIYNSLLLRYAIHFHQNYKKHKYNLEKNPQLFLEGRGDTFNYLEDSTFDLVPLWREKISKNEKNRMETMKYLKNMGKMTELLDKEINYGIITYVLEQIKHDTEHARVKQNNIIKFYRSVDRAKKILRGMTGGKSETLDSIVDDAGQRYRKIKKEMRKKEGRDEDEYSDDEEFNENNPKEYLEKYKTTLKRVTQEVTNNFGNKLANGEIDIKEFFTLAKNMSSNIPGMNMPDIDESKLDINRLKEVQKNKKGNFVNVKEMESVINSVIDKFGNIVLGGEGSNEPPVSEDLD